MEEIATGLWHWSALHEHTGLQAHSYLLAAERVVLDPMLPGEGLEWFERHGRPEHVLLTNRHHDRDAWILREAFGCEVHCPRSGLQELVGRGALAPFDFGDELPGGVIAHEVDAICPDETALEIPAHRALACADGVVRWPQQPELLTFVPDFLMDDPPQTKAALCAAYRRLLALDFDLLLLAHGEPVVGGGREALRAFVEAHS
jgi:glyoxylase-like metal-dependent hydrolase (beta-lactamase superfamily II)